MAWYYTEPRPQRRPLDTPVRPAGGGGTGGPPTGPAGGDLTGTYPNPTIGPGAVGDAEITSVSYAKVTGAPTIPTTLPPSGPAGGDLAGTYPNPDVKALAVGTPELADGAVTDAKVTSVAYGKVTGAPTSLPPSGTAGGDLSGSYPNPQLAAGAIVDADVSATAAIQYSKLTGTPTSLPPSGAASGDLTGTYPGPTIAAAKVTAPKLSPAPVAGDVGKMVTIATGPALAYTAVPTTLPPSGAASGDLTGSYPGPTIAAGAVTDAKIADVAATKLTGTIAQARLPTAPAGLLTANLNDAQVTNAKIADVAWGKVTGAPTSLPPSGTASGDLTGTYPGPTIAAGAVTTTKLGDAPNGVTTAKLNDGAVTNVKIADVAWTKITGAPTSFPPSGAASGDLAGTYPAPTIGAGKVVTAALADAPNGVATGKLNDGAVTNAKIADVAWGKITGAPTSFPPSGTAGGDLTGSYPNPTLAAGAVSTADLADAPNGVSTAKLNALAVTDAKINDVAWTKVTGAPTSLPPSGAASGDLSGTYPGPTVGKLNGAAVGTTTPLARGDLLVADATPALKRLALGTASQVLQSNGTDVVWGASLGGPPSGAAGGDLQGTYPNPTINPTKLPWSVSGATLTPTDATKLVAVPGASTGEVLRLGTRTIKQRLICHPTVDATYLTANLGYTGSAWTQDDAARPGWSAALRPDGFDAFVVYRAPAGSVSPAQLLTLDSVGQLTLNSGRLSKGRVVTSIVSDWAALTANRVLAADGSTWSQDDVTKPSWTVFAGVSDTFNVNRTAAGGGSGGTALVTVDNGGNLTITGATATKASGTTWANPSDRRLKKNIQPYATGLAAVQRLAPVSFQFNGKGGSQDGLQAYGFLADEVEPVMPEMVGSRRGKLDETDEEETEIRTLDSSNVTLALVNAVKELAAHVSALTVRVAALEGR